MNVAYIVEQGVFLTKEGDVLQVKKGPVTLQSIHAHKLSQLIVTGNVTLTTQTIAFLLEKGIDTVFLSVYGKYRGRLTAEFSKNIEARKAQFTRFADPGFALGLARQFVIGKLSNSLVVLRRRLAEHRNASLVKGILGVRALLRRIPQAADLDELRGLEGAAATIYFRVFGKLIQQPGFPFQKRTRRPPLDRTNALLSLCYTLLNNTVQSVVSSSGLDPYYGVFHQPEYGRPSLGLDLMEEFRPVIADTLVLGLINRGIARPADFVEEAGAELPVRLTPLAMKKVILQYEKRLRQEVFLAEAGKTLDYQQIIQRQFFLLQRHVTGEEEYSPFLMRR